MSGEQVERTINIHDLVLIKVLLPAKAVAIINDKNGEYLENFCKSNNVEIKIADENEEKKKRKNMTKTNEEKLKDKDTKKSGNNEPDDGKKILKVIGEYSKVLVAINMISVLSTLDIKIDSDKAQQLTVLIDDDLEDLLIKKNEEVLNIIRKYSGAELRIENKEKYKCLIINGVFTANSKACKLLLRVINDDENVKYIRKSMIDVTLNLNNERNKYITISETLKHTGFKDSDVNEILTAFNVLTKYGLLTITKSKQS